MTTPRRRGSRVATPTRLRSDHSLTRGRLEARAAYVTEKFGITEAHYLNGDVSFSVASVSLDVPRKAPRSQVIHFEVACMIEPAASTGSRSRKRVTSSPRSLAPG